MANLRLDKPLNIICPKCGRGGYVYQLDESGTIKAKCINCNVYFTQDRLNEIYAIAPQEFAQKTNYDVVIQKSPEELEKWFWWMLKYVQGYTDSRAALHYWLRKECDG